MSHTKFSALALAVSSVLTGTGFAGHEIAGESKQQIIAPAGPSVGGDVSAGYWSKYIFRGTNLTPDSDGLIWASGTLHVQPWENGSFMFTIWAGSQLGNAQVHGVERIGEAGGTAIPNGAGTRTGFNGSSITAADPSLQPLADAINDAYTDNFNDPNGISGQDFIQYLKDEFSILGQPGKSTREIRNIYRSAFGKGIPNNVTRFKTTNEAIQDRFTEIDFVAEYRHQFFDGKLEVAIGNIFFYIDRESKSRATVQEFFASDQAREFVNNLNESTLTVPTGPRSSLSAPVLTLRQDHPEDFLLNKGKKVKITRNSTGDEQFDRIYVDVTTNLLAEFWGLKPHLIYYHTVLNEGDSGDQDLLTDRYDVTGGYLEYSMSAYVPLIKSGTPASNDFKTGKAIAGDEKIKLSMEPSFRVSYSFRDRASADGTPLTGFNHLQLGVQLTWNVTDTFSIRPMMSYARHLTEPTPGTDRDEWWGGASMAVSF